MESACLTIIGSGTLLPSATRRSAALHLTLPPVADGPRSILLDCGAGTLHGLAACGVDWETVDVVALSHDHPDHVSDLVPLLAAFRFRRRERPLVLTGPSDTTRLLDGLGAAYGEWVRAPGFPLLVRPIGPDGAWSDPAGTVHVTAHPVPHRDTSIAYRVDGAWGRAGYTGDTGPSPTLGRFLAGCDVLVAECALADPPEVEGHLSPSTLAVLASEARPALLLVTHVYPPRSPALAASEVRARWDGRVEAALDGMRIVLGGSGRAVGPPAPTVDPPAAAE
jgi:ribonuclease BN (tRNA processing enzyme)